MGAARCDPLGRCPQDLDGNALVEATLETGVAEAYPLPGQGIVDEERLAVEVGQAPTLVGQTLDLNFD